MNNNELYHYGVPGMRWGRRKGPTVNGQNVRVSKKQTATQKPKKQPKQEQPQESEPAPSKSKKGWLIAGAVLAVIGTVVIAKKLGKAKSGNLAKRIDSGKEAVAKMTKVKTPKSPKPPKLPKAPKVKTPKAKVPKIHKNKAVNVINKSSIMPNRRYINIYR